MQAVFKGPLSNFHERGWQANGLQTDTIGKKAKENDEYMYLFKENVPISPMEMIDDVATVTECGVDAVEKNAYIIIIIIVYFRTHKMVQIGSD